ncbi:GMC oxidoreductase [Paenibacillus sp. Soil522]|uniref:GMC oxidoreductase n=1 Tax=Paenibacillus sp. Soil522 TaxID=1736388 RepID=UPI003FA7D373
MPRLTFSWGPQVAEKHRYYYSKAVEILQAAKALNIWGGTDVQQPWQLRHPSGGTRMGENPLESVTDRYGKVHGTRNLFVAGNSLFPTMSAFNPTETIGALAYWQADYIKQAVLHGDLIRPPSPAINRILGSATLRPISVLGIRLSVCVQKKTVSTRSRIRRPIMQIIKRLRPQPSGRKALAPSSSVRLEKLRGLYGYL